MNKFKVPLNTKNTENDVDEDLYLNIDNKETLTRDDEKIESLDSINKKFDSVNDDTETENNEKSNEADYNNIESKNSEEYKLVTNDYLDIDQEENNKAIENFKTENDMDKFIWQNTENKQEPKESNAQDFDENVNEINTNDDNNESVDDVIYLKDEEIDADELTDVTVVIQDDNFDLNRFFGLINRIKESINDSEFEIQDSANDRAEDNDSNENNFDNLDFKLDDQTQKLKSISKRIKNLETMAIQNFQINLIFIFISLFLITVFLVKTFIHKRNKIFILARNKLNETSKKTSLNV